METRAYLLHALSPLHAGIGSSTGPIDLPIARMKATGMPFVPGSSIKGVLRDARASAPGFDEPKIFAVFGPKKDPSENGGAIGLGDARLLALPVRSFKGTFAWVTSPLLLTLANRDLGTSHAVPTFAARGAKVTTRSVCVYSSNNATRLYLEDLDLQATEYAALDAWTEALAPQVSPGTDILSDRFVVVDDDTMTFLWETATQVEARVRLNDNRVVAKGALWQEESLPAETLLIGLIVADKSRRSGVTLDAQEVLDFALPQGNAEPVLQFGGKASVGRGRCRMVRIN